MARKRRIEGQRARQTAVRLGLLILPVLVVAMPLHARSGGINGYSGDPATNGGSICNACHSGGTAPTVTLAGPTLVAPGAVNTYTLTITGGQETAGGLDVAATSGSLAVADPGTYLRSGEITHNAPRGVDGTGAVTFSFNWSAPLSAGTATLYGAGNSVNLGSGSNGDRASSDTLAIMVAAASTPGESSGAGVVPLRVTGLDPSSGDMSLSFESGCEATDNHLYYGPLGSVGSYGWTGETCAVGTGGVVSGFNPGPGSFFFVIVGAKGSDEGSYGLDRQTAGAQGERPSFAANACGTAQTLADRCD